MWCGLSLFALACVWLFFPRGWSRIVRRSSGAVCEKPRRMRARKGRVVGRSAPGPRARLVSL